MTGSSYSRIVLFLSIAPFILAGSFSKKALCEEIFMGPEIVVTATRIEWPLKKTAGFVTVITKEEIRSFHSERVSDVLRSVPSLSVVSSGSPGKATSVFLRGASSSHVLVMLDGVPLNDPATGAFDFSDFSTAGIERIEIVRGPHTVLYGTSAIGGAINIITTSKHKELERNITLSGGSFGTAEGTVSISGGSSMYSYSYAISGFITEGSGQNDFHRSGSFSGSVATSMREGSDLTLTLRYNRSSTGLCGQIFAIDPNERQSGASVIASATYREIVNDLWNYEIRASLLSREITWDDPEDQDDGDPLSGNSFSEIASNALGAAWQNNIRFEELLWITAGTEWKDELTTNSGYSPWGTTSFDDRIYNASAYLNCIFDSPNLPTLSAGLRLDSHSEFGSVATYRASLSQYIEAIETTLKASMGTGFRAPSLNELYYPGYGNPALSPEHSEGWDCGVRAELLESRASIEASYFENRYRDMISFDFETFAAGNIGEARSNGFELHFALRPRSRVSFEGHYVYTKTEDISSGTWLLRRPKHSGGASFSVAGRSWRGSVSCNAVGRRLDNDFGGPRGEHFAEPFVSVNALLAWRPVQNWEIFCRGGNILDERYEEAAGYPALPRSTIFGTEIAF